MGWEGEQERGRRETYVEDWWAAEIVSHQSPAWTVYDLEQSEGPVAKTAAPSTSVDARKQVNQLTNSQEAKRRTEMGKANMVGLPWRDV